MRDRQTLAIKRQLKRYWWLSRQPTRRWRALPDFIVIGCQKAGTTSLYRYLCSHPQIRRPFGQEPVFFSHEINYARGANYYKANFALAHRMHRDAPTCERMITGEASGEYVYYPAAPERIAQLLPSVRLIVLLRDPVRRTISHYFHNVSHGFEDRTLENAINQEINWHQQWNPTTGPSHRRFGKWGSARAYLGRSMYWLHLQRWLELFSPSQLLILSAEEVWSNPSAAMNRTYDFLSISTARQATRFARHNAGSTGAVRDETLSWLGSAFEEPNRALARLLDQTCGLARPTLGWLPDN